MSIDTTAVPTSASIHHAQADIGRTLCQGIVYAADATNPAKLEYAAEEYRNPLADTVAASDTAGASDRPGAQLEPSARDTCMVKMTADESGPVGVEPVRRGEPQKQETRRDHPAVQDKEHPEVVHVVSPAVLPQIFLSTRGTPLYLVKSGIWRAEVCVTLRFRWQGCEMPPPSNGWAPWDLASTSPPSQPCKIRASSSFHLC